MKGEPETESPGPALQGSLELLNRSVFPLNGMWLSGEKAVIVPESASLGMLALADTLPVAHQ